MESSLEAYGKHHHETNIIVTKENLRNEKAWKALQWENESCVKDQIINDGHVVDLNERVWESL